MRRAVRARLSSLRETAHTDAVADDDDRSRDASSAAGPGWSDPGQPDVSWADAVAPDDISELAPEIAAYHRERRADRRRELYRWLTRRPGATPLTLVIAALALVAIVTTLLTVMGPTTGGTGPSKVQLASTSATPGHIGGLLPSVGVATKDGTPISSLSLRPGAVALLPEQCDCDSQITGLDEAANTAEHSPLFVVAPSAYPSPAADTLQGQLRAAVLYDRTAALRAGVGAMGLTVILVGRDGRIYDIRKNVTSARGVSAELLSMLATPENTA
jgi:hypothetical protein